MRGEDAQSALFAFVMGDLRKNFVAILVRDRSGKDIQICCSDSRALGSLGYPDMITSMSKGEELSPRRRLSYLVVAQKAFICASRESRTSAKATQVA